MRLIRPQEGQQGTLRGLGLDTTGDWGGHGWALKIILDTRGCLVEPQTELKKEKKESLVRVHPLGPVSQVVSEPLYFVGANSQTCQLLVEEAMIDSVECCSVVKCSNPGHLTHRWCFGPGSMCCCNCHGGAAAPKMESKLALGKLILQLWWELEEDNFFPVPIFTEVGGRIGTHEGEAD